ncbi:Probable beta-1,3-galactosyltransferase 12 [Linum perenne]
MPLFSHRSHSSSSSSLPTVSSKTFKPKKSGLLPSSFSVRHISPILIFSFFSLLVGIAGTLFAITAIRRPQPLPVFRCGGSEDTFRAFYSASAHRLGGDHNDHELVDRPKFLGFVGIQTGFDSVDRRAALRETWFPSDPDGLLRLEQATGLAFRFVIGYSKDPKKMQQLQKEVEKYRDFLIIDNEEEYHRLATLLAKERTHSRTYIGCMKKGPVITDPKLKCFRMFSNEDVTIGSWMLAMDVKHEDNRAICDPQCTSTSIAVWDIPKCSGI